jgi:hypothetical protein
MAFNVNNFINSMAKDGARPNLFEIIFTDAGQNFTIRARASSLPASSIGMASAYYFGRLAKFAGNRTFADWAVTVLVDEPDFVSGPRAALERWSNSLNAHVANNRSAAYLAPVGYQKDATIIQYGKTGNAIATYLMRGCFPVDVGAMGLDWGANDTISEFSVTFAMQYWERTETTT